MEWKNAADGSRGRDAGRCRTFSRSMTNFDVTESKQDAAYLHRVLINASFDCAWGQVLRDFF